MSQVLQYGFPTGERLRCDNPLCDELAEHTAKIASSDGEKEIFGCSTHIEQLCTDRMVTQMRKLKKPGERNQGEAK